jgi:hypothetical protein
MSKDEIKRAVEQLSPQEFARLATWIDQKRAQKLPASGGYAVPTRDHSAFLNSYAPEDEGLYDNAPSR